MLHAGRLEIEGAKKTVEQAIGDAKAIKGVWDWFIGLFTTKPDAPKPVAKKKISAKQQSYNELEAKLFNDIGLQLGTLFDVQQQINDQKPKISTKANKTNNP